MCGKGEFEHVIVGGQATAQRFPILLACLNELRQPLSLYPANRGLGIERFEVVAQVAVGVLMGVGGICSRCR